ncbi:MAG TPA: SprT-like domain-containing protein [Dissulfurispiraceae bacterium]|nr:SprT-like domain-containing protein [Dissulfurispiraceae bacterium]
MKKLICDRQLSLMFVHNADSLSGYLEARIGRKVSVVLTQNSTSMLSSRVKDGIMHVRLHRMFISAGNDVIHEIVRFLKNSKGDMTRFRQFIRDNREELHNRPHRKVSVRTSGRFHNLRELFDEINKEYFDDRVDSSITWGTCSSRYSVRKRTLGSFSAGANVIRISPVLDRKSVPRYFVAFVIYHEMLHAAVGIMRQGDRRIAHSREFRQRERLFRDYERAMAWERRSY